MAWHRRNWDTKETDWDAKVRCETLRYLRAGDRKKKEKDGSWSRWSCWSLSKNRLRCEVWGKKDVGSSALSGFRYGFTPATHVRPLEHKFKRVISSAGPLSQGLLESPDASCGLFVLDGFARWSVSLARFPAQWDGAILSAQIRLKTSHWDSKIRRFEMMRVAWTQAHPSGSCQDSLAGSPANEERTREAKMGRKGEHEWCKKRKNSRGSMNSETSLSFRYGDKMLMVLFHKGKGKCRGAMCYVITESSGHF